MSGTDYPAELSSKTVAGLHKHSAAELRLTALSIVSHCKNGWDHPVVPSVEKSAMAQVFATLAVSASISEDTASRAKEHLVDN